MNRRHFIGTVAALAAAISLQAVPAKQPNILWIITDDQRTDSLACYNQATLGTTESRLGFVSSPHIDKLAEEGVIFTSAYCNAPVCGPTRASMHTGAYPHHSGRYAFEQSHQRADISLITVPQVMRKLGYTAASFGKSGFLIAGDHYNDDVDDGELAKHGLTDFTSQTKRKPDDWSPEGIILHQENYRYADGSTQNATLIKEGGLSPEEQKETDKVYGELQILHAYTRELSNLICGGQSPMPTEKTLDGEIAAAFSTYLENAGKTYETAWGKKMTGPDPEKPLFTHLGFHFPHTPVLPSAEYRKMFADKKYNLPAFDKSEVSRMPEWLRNIYIKMNFVDMTPKDQQQAIRDYYAFCAMGDQLIGESIEKFKAYSEKQGRDWLILYVVGDHGWHLGEQGIHAKFAPWARTTHGGVIAASSDKSAFPPGSVCDKLVEYVDFAPTFYEAAGLQNPKAQYPHLDGVALPETISAAKERPYSITEVNHVTGPWACMRTRDFLFGMKTRPFYNYPPDYKCNENVKWGLEAPREKVQLVIYDLRVDPDERCNLADTPEYVELADWFRNKLGNIVLGDRRVEVNWKADNEYNISNFAPGSDDKKLDILPELIPGPERARHIFTREFDAMLKTDPKL